MTININAEWTTIIAAIVGGLLAGGTGWFISYSKDCRDFKRKADFFTEVIKDDLNKAMRLYKKLVKEWEKDSIISFDTLGELAASREIYNKNKEWLFIYPESIRNNIWDYYYQSGVLTDYISYLENCKLQILIPEQEMQLCLKNQNPSMSQEQINNQVKYTRSISQRPKLEWINESLPQKINVCRKLIQEAEIILIELNRIKINNQKISLRKN